jgi:tryptophan-rich sensory protein
MGGRLEFWKVLLISVLAALGVETLGGLMTDLSPWYYALHKPDWQPPGWLFAPVWTTIFLLAAVACAMAWTGTPTPEIRRRILAASIANAIFNVLWSALFFMMQRPDWALIEVVPFWISIVVMALTLARGSRAAAWLLAPYLLWVTFASYLNWTIVRLNSPFG